MKATIFVFAFITLLSSCTVTHIGSQEDGVWMEACDNCAEDVSAEEAAILKAAFNKEY